MFCISPKAASLALATSLFYVSLSAQGATTDALSADVIDVPTDKTIEPIVVEPLPVPIKIGNSANLQPLSPEPHRQHL